METGPGKKREKEICVLYVTAPPSQSETLAKSLLAKHLVACVSIMPVRSLYRWKGESCEDSEDLLIIKTRKSLVQATIAAVKVDHPYEVPEIIALPVITGHAPYLDWVYGETDQP
ncbi:divalent-cation tolerance protein CutA [Methanoregula sp.]|uniref:divalent-cation tolerance protein CutA n=1 Tax=Methanoregula sp. TaxID=2052170 RepID=UPI002B6FFDA2|nr:divalent-cation tolerance protein CutA [Methanoregula sp.]HVP97102.1 divalent-cation tolerance protein CutA [Methanoregula sp.]